MSSSLCERFLYYLVFTFVDFVKFKLQSNALETGFRPETLIFLVVPIAYVQPFQPVNFFFELHRANYLGTNSTIQICNEYVIQNLQNRMTPFLLFLK